MCANFVRPLPGIFFSWQCSRHKRRRSWRHYQPSANNAVRQPRAKRLDLCADYEARIEIIYLEPPLPQRLAQNRNRTTAVPESIIQRLLDKLEPPTRVEVHAVRLVG